MPMSQQERAARTILPLKAALYQEARRVGITAIAERFGHGVQGLSNNLNPNNLDRKPTLDQFEDIAQMAVAEGGGELIRDSLGKVLGCTWVPFPGVDATPGPMLMKEMSALLDRVSATAADVSEAVADGQVDDDEVAMLEKDAARIYQAVQQLVESAKAYREVRS